MKPLFTTGMPRRRFFKGAASTLALAGLPLRATIAGEDAGASRPVIADVSGTDIQLDIAYQPVNITGKKRTATTVNQSLPGPVLRFKEGDDVRITVHNHLSVDSSIHWHGIILPTEMDGVPGLSFDGIKPGGSYEYRFTLKQNGTYWYHSHSGYQEQTGLYGALIIDPAEPEPFHTERDYVVLLADWSDESPQQIEATLKKNSHYYAVNQRNAGHFFREARTNGFWATVRERSMWNTMRMSDRDIADVTGKTYSMLMNGCTQHNAWQGQFRRGETVRLRLINAAAMTFFDVRIPGVKMTVVAADGQLIQPVEVDELRIANAETYDVLVTPQHSCTVFAQAMDRSSWVHGFLVDETGQLALIPAMDSMPELQHNDMGMSHQDHSNHAGAVQDSHQHNAVVSQADHAHTHHQPVAVMDHSQHGAHAHHAMNEHSMMNHSDHVMHAAAKPVLLPMIGSGLAGFGSAEPVVHNVSEFGPHVDMHAENPQYRLDDPGPGLRHHQHLLNRRVLTYADLKNYYPVQDTRQPSREIQMHLTGNMHRYLWSIDGISHHHSAPLILKYGERVRFTLVNDTMMSHPMHLHGLWSELETGDATYIPKKHTVIVQPGSKISFLVTADALGKWAFHCHLLYHMNGMMRTVEVVA